MYGHTSQLTRLMMPTNGQAHDLEDIASAHGPAAHLRFLVGFLLQPFLALMCALAKALMLPLLALLLTAALFLRLTAPLLRVFD